MPRVDADLVLKKIKMMRADLANLKKFEKITFSEYMADDLKRASIERFLEKITGRMIDINYHILREEYEILPDDYYGSFIQMGKNKVITEELAVEIAKSSGLRNALAHEYVKIDDQKVFNSIKTALVEIPQYIRKVLEFLD